MKRPSVGVVEEFKHVQTVFCSLLGLMEGVATKTLGMGEKGLILTCKIMCLSNMVVLAVNIRGNWRGHIQNQKTRRNVMGTCGEDM